MRFRLLLVLAVAFLVAACGAATPVTVRPLDRGHHGRPTTTTTTVVSTTTTAASTTTTTVAPTTTTTAASTTTTTQPVVNQLSVAVSGNQLLDGSGAPVDLHGVNRSGLEYACVQWGGPFDGPSDAASITAIASWHTNAVRMGLNEDCWLGINGTPVGGLSAAAYRADVVAYVNLLHAHGLYAILELHVNAPGALVSTGQQQMPDADHAPAFWASVAQAFKGDPATAFDLYNEPYPGNNADTAAAWTCWHDGGACPGIGFTVAGMQSLTNAVRSAGSHNVILLGGVQFANALGSWLAYRPSDPTGQTAASFHVYQGQICATVTCWNATVAPVAAVVPVVTGEIGDTDGQAGFINTYMGWADARGIGYLAWVWDTWGCSNIVLISNYNGTACPGYGAGYQAHLAG